MTSCKSKMSFGFHWKKALPQRKVRDLVLARIYARMCVHNFPTFLALACIRNTRLCCIYTYLDIYVFLETMRTDLQVNCVTNRSGIRVLKKFLFFIFRSYLFKNCRMESLNVWCQHLNTVDYTFFLNHIHENMNTINKRFSSIYNIHSLSSNIIQYISCHVYEKKSTANLCLK